MAPLPQARYHISAATLDNSVFVFGENDPFYFELFFLQCILQVDIIVELQTMFGATSPSLTRGWTPGR